MKTGSWLAAAVPEISVKAGWACANVLGDVKLVRNWWAAGVVLLSAACFAEKIVWSAAER